MWWATQILVSKMRISHCSRTLAFSFWISRRVNGVIIHWTWLAQRLNLSIRNNQISRITLKLSSIIRNWRWSLRMLKSQRNAKICQNQSACFSTLSGRNLSLIKWKSERSSKRFFLKSSEEACKAIKRLNRTSTSRFLMEKSYRNSNPSKLQSSKKYLTWVNSTQSKTWSMKSSCRWAA